MEDSLNEFDEVEKKYSLYVLSKKLLAFLIPILICLLIEVAYTYYIQDRMVYVIFLITIAILFTILYFLPDF